MRKLVVILSVIFGISIMAMAWAQEDNFKLKFKTMMVDTSAGRSTNSTNLEGGTTADGKAFYIVQFDGPVLDEWKKALESKGVKFFSYIPENAFLVKLDPATQSSILFRPHVQYVGEYRPEYKISPFLNETVKKTYATFATSASTDAVLTLKVKVFDKEPLKPVIAAIEKMNGTVEVLADGDGLNEKILKVEIPFYKAGGIAGLAEVEWVEQYPYARFCMDAVRTITGAEVAQHLPSNITFANNSSQGRTLNGKGQILGILDSGLDTGDISTLQAPFRGTVSNGQRKISGAKSYRDDKHWWDEPGHGTTVAGCMTGKDMHDPFNAYHGMAPDARLYVQSGQSHATYMVTPDLNKVVFFDAYAAGVRVHNDSWDSEFGGVGEYNLDCVAIDTFTWIHKDFLPVVSVSNYSKDKFYNYSSPVTKGKTKDGIPDPGSIHPPGTAKNALSVGASHSFKNTSSKYTDYSFASITAFINSPISGTNMGGNNTSTDPVRNKVMASSGRGPTGDGRIKPDVVAPGTAITSTRSAYPNLITYYLKDLSGTSIATGVVSGAAALIRQYYMDMRGISPSAALVKATIINGAQDIGAHVSESTRSPRVFPTITSTTTVPVADPAYLLHPFARPDFSQGWGLLDVMNSVYPGQSTGDATASPQVFLAFVDNKSGVKTNQGKSYIFHLKNTGTVRVTLAWSDYPAAAGAKTQLVNDLDLTVYDPDGNPHTTKGLSGDDPNRPWWQDPDPDHYDKLNNVEGAEFFNPYPFPVDFIVGVHGANVPIGPQAFAIAVTGPLDMDANHNISGSAFPYTGKVAGLFGGSVVVVATGPVITYAWTNPDGSFTLSNLTPGNYYLNVYDSLGIGTLLSQVKDVLIKVNSSTITNKKAVILRCNP